MSSGLEQAYDYCQRVTRLSSSNFYYTFRTLPAEKRKAIYASYAYCRLCDDIVDGNLPSKDKHRLISETRAHLRNSINNETSHPVFVALADTSTRFDIPISLFEEIISGVEMDLMRTRYGTFLELKEYCYKVASSVGLICVQVFGYRQEEAKKHAVDLGIAMQLTNIIRDVREDTERNRIYIPSDEMSCFGYSEMDLQNGLINDTFRNMMRFQVWRARKYFEAGPKLIPMLDSRSQPCPTALYDTYTTILDHIETRGYNVFDHRIGLGPVEKLRLVTKLWKNSIIAAMRRKYL